MGFDYSFITVTKKSDKSKLMSFIAQHVIMENTNFGARATIVFKSDETIREYLSDSFSESDKEESPDQLLNALHSETAEIGYIYFDIKEVPDAQFIYTRFTAATTNMSLLFCNSASVKDWFIHFGKTVNAIAVFLDLEDQDYKFIFQDGLRVDVSVSGNTELNSADRYEEIIKNYQSSWLDSSE